MEKRFVKLYLHKSQSAALEKMLEKDEITIMSKSQIDEKQYQYEFIINATGSDNLLDRIEHDFSKIKDFHMYFFNIEAEIPRPKEPEKEEEKKENKYVFQRLTRQELYNDINKDVTISVSYILLIIISSIIAGIGLIRDNSTIIIGSMVIAPFLGSNVSLAFSTTIGDRKTLLQSLEKLFIGIGISFSIALLWGFFYKIDPSVYEIASRTTISITDIILAFITGVAAILSVNKGVVDALVGVMVAVAFMPPIIASGLLIGNGMIDKGLSALLLFFINIVAINLAGVLTFLVEGLRPSTYWEEKNAKKYRIISLIIWIFLLSLMSYLLYIIF
jgi:uncharacterized hydrophobic protein (TIGR00341 family)